VAEIADDAWREAEAAMDAMLRSRGIDPETAADVRQAVAVRAVERQRERPFQTRTGFVKWAVWVAWNQATDFWRAERRRRIAPVSVPDLPDVDHGDVEERARLRVAIAEVARALAQLTAFERDALEAPLRRDYTKSTAAERERRYEARAALRRSVRDFPAMAGLAVRRAWRRLARTASFATSVPVAATLVAALLATSPSGTGSGAPRSRTSTTTRPMTVAAAFPGDPRGATPSASPTRAGRSPTARRVGVRTGGATAPPPRVDVAVPHTTGVHLVAPPNDHTEPLLCTASFATPRTCVDLPHQLIRSRGG